MKPIDNPDLASLASGFAKVLSEELGGEFGVTVIKYQRTKASFLDTELQLELVITDRSAIERSAWFRKRSLVPDGPIDDPKIPVTPDQFRSRALREESEIEVTYDVRPLHDDQQAGVHVFLGDLVAKRDAAKLPIRKPIQFLVEEQSFQPTQEVDELVAKLAQAGLPIRFSVLATEVAP